MSDTPRACGACTACCAVLGVPELDKPAHRTCAHLRDTGCAVYAERPGSCRSFECQWLRGALEVDGGVDPDLRPDACGVIFDYQPESAFGEVFTAWECEAGASSRGPASRILAELAEHFLVMVVSPPSSEREGPGSRRFVGPPPRVRQASDVMWSRGRIGRQGKTTWRQ